MAKIPTEILWEKLEVYRGQQVWATHIGLYVVRCAMYVRVSADLKVIYAYVDDYYKTKLN